MPRKHLVGSVAAAAVGLVLLSACGTQPQTGASPKVAPAAAQAENQAQAVSLNVAQVNGLGEVLTDQDGMTLYRFDNDTAEPPASTCVDDCAAKWPPVMSTGDVQVAGVDKALVGEVARPDGTQQVTVKGWPVYRFAKDTAPGQAGGQGVGDVWFAVNAQGGKAGQPKPAALTATDIPNFGPALTDEDGFTLYLFTKDSKNPSQSTCDGDCASKWPPVMATGDDISLTGVDPAIVGRVVRSNGAEQVTVGGWPVYRFAKDTEPGQTNGHGVGGTWFAIEAAGCKSSAPVPAPAEAPAEAPADTGSGY